MEPRGDMLGIQGGPLREGHLKRRNERLHFTMNSFFPSADSESIIFKIEAMQYKLWNKLRQANEVSLVSYKCPYNLVFNRF